MAKVKRRMGKTMSKMRIIGGSVLAMGALLLSCLPLAAQDNNTTIQLAVRFASSPPLSELAKLPQTPQPCCSLGPQNPHIPKPQVAPTVDRAQQRAATLSPNFSLIAHILGVGYGYPNYSVPDAPPDTNMAVGDTQIVQWVNVSYIVCDKTPGSCSGIPILGNTLWSSLGGICANNNDGDIIAQWDRIHHRWILAQNVFTGSYGVCVAVSQTNDAMGAYYLYQFPVVNGGFPDYPKWGNWPTGYFQTWNNFGPGGSGFKGPVFCGYHSAKMIAGDPSAEQICHQYSSSEDSLLPGDLDSPGPPPKDKATGAWQDEFAIGSVGDVDNSHLSLYSMHINNQSDWSQGATFTGDGNSQLLPIMTFTPACNGAYGGDCVPQKSIPDKLDSLGDRLMYRFAYWNDISPTAVACALCNVQHWYVNWDVTASGGNIGPRWMEIQAASLVVQPSALHVYQQGTFAPDGNWRWMGSIARDNANDVLLGFSESCGDTCPGGTPTFPSVAVAGRVASDPLGTLEAELLYVNGTGSQPDTSNRWGDYSAMRIDPVDNCTFWFTTEYYQINQRFDWSTDIGKFKFSNCH